MFGTYFRSSDVDRLMIGLMRAIGRTTYDYASVGYLLSRELFSNSIPLFVSFSQSHDIRRGYSYDRLYISL